MAPEKIVPGRSETPLVYAEPLKTALIYALIGSVWILATDKVVVWLFEGSSALLWAQTFKGLLYIGMTAGLVYWLARRTALRIERHAAEAQVRTVQNLLEKILTSLDDVVLVIDPGTRTIVQCNDAVVRVFGYAPDELIGKNTAILYEHRKDYEDFGAISEPILEKNGAFRTEYRMKKKDGTQIETEHTITAIDDNLGWRSGVVSVVRDITAGKRAEEALRKSEEKYRLLADNTLDVIWAMDMGQVFTYVNPAIARLMGYAPAEFVGTRLQDHCDETEYAKISAVIEQAIATGQGHDGVVFETELLRKDGSRVAIEVRGRALFDEQRHPTVIQGTSRDITERRNLENQMRQAQKMEGVGQLAGGVAHDFNNLLTVILGTVQIEMMNMKPTDAFYEKFQDIGNAAQRAADLTQQLLAFARKQMISPKVLDINDTIETQLKMLRRLIGENIKMSWKPGKKRLSVKMDPVQISQIFANLAVNARDAINGVGCIEIETGQVVFDEAYCAQHAGFFPGQYVVVSVRDDGAGMDRETLGKIFEPFFTTKPVGQGTGLGLATVYGIVKQNAGFINVYSEPGQGTVFRIYLPPFVGSSAQAAGVPASKEMPRGTETVLLVEDEDAVLQLARRYLEHLGYAVLAANGPGRALEMMREFSGEIDLLMTDIVMPDMNGRDLYNHLAALCPDTKCLFMSGYPADAMANRGILAEDMHFIQKPFSLEEVGAKLREALGG